MNIFETLNKRSFGPAEYGFEIRMGSAAPKQPGRAAVVLTEKRLRQVLDVPKNVRIMGATHDIMTGNLTIVLEAQELPEKANGATVLSMSLNEVRGRLGDR